MWSLRSIGWRNWAVAALCVGVGLVGACAQTGLAQAQAGCPSDAPHLRVLVHFRQAIDGPSAEVLQGLRLHSDACVTFVNSVSPSIHTYAVSAGDPVRLRQNLLLWPSVLDVVVDHKTTHRAP